MEQASVGERRPCAWVESPPRPASAVLSLNRARDREAKIPKRPAPSKQEEAKKNSRLRTTSSF